MLRIIRDEGLRRHRPRQLRFDHGEGEGQESIARAAFGHVAHAAALLVQLLHVDLGDQQAGFVPLLRQNRAVFGDQVMAGKDQVSGGLPVAAQA